MRVPNPWAVLEGTDLLLWHVDMPEEGRYYNRPRVIFLRQGLLLVEQRATLWHELVHARRRDTACTLGKAHGSVDREAARWAMPLDALVWSWRGDPCITEVADRLKTTESLLRIRMNGLHPAELGHLRRCAAAREDAA